MVGCSAPQSLVAGGRLVGVTPDESELLFLENPVFTPDGDRISGRLVAQSLGAHSGRVTLDDDEVFARLTAGGWLVYGVDPQLANGGSLFSVKAWKSDFPASVSVGDSLASYIQLTRPGDTVFLETNHDGDGTLTRAPLADCSASGCPTAQLGTNIGRYGPLFDQRHVLLAADDSEESVTFRLFDAEAGSSTVLGMYPSLGGSSNTVHFGASLDGTRLALVPPDGSLVVIDGATLQPISWGAIPQGFVEHVLFLDDDTLLVLATDSSGGSLYRVTSSSAFRITSTVSFQAIFGPDLAPRALFLQDEPVAADGTRPIRLTDFDGKTLLEVSDLALGDALISDDGRFAYLIEQAGPNRQLLAVDIDGANRSVLGWFDSVEFGVVPGSDDMVFQMDGGPLQLWSSSDGSIVRVAAAGAIGFFPTRSRKLYVNRGAVGALYGDIDVVPLP
jgi:hypothetical protein